MKIKTLFYILTGVAIVMVLTVAWVGIVNMRSANEAMQEIETVRYPKVRNLKNFDTAVSQLVITNQNILGTSNLSHEARVSELRRLLAMKHKEDEEILDAFNKYDATKISPEMQNDWDEVKKIWGQWPLAHISSKMLEEALGNPTPENIASWHAKMSETMAGTRSVTPVMRQKTNVLMINDMDIIQALVSEATRMQQKVITVQIVLSLIAVMVIILTALKMWASTFPPLDRMIRVMQQATRDLDLSSRVDYNSENEVGTVVRCYNSLMQEIQGSFKDIYAEMEGVNKSLETLSTISHEVARSSNSQANSIQQMAVSVEEMSASISTISASASDTKNVAIVAGENANEGNKAINAVLDGMSGISDVVAKSSDVITQLGVDSERISSIVHVIREVADQTNLLALNASIEAARAGEHGRGFAVVADEVRKLAERTAQSTLDITSMVSKIQVSAKNANSEMSLVMKNVDDELVFTREAGEKISLIQGGASTVSAAINEINQALHENSRTINEIASHMDSISQMTAENDSAIKEAEHSVENLGQLVVTVRKTMNKFKT